MSGIRRFGTRMTLLHIALVLLVGILVSYAVIRMPDAPKILSEEGVLDVSQVNIRQHPLNLAGEWTFYWQELLSPEDIRMRAANERIQDRWISLPNSWLGYPIDGRKLDGTGYATFRLVIAIGEHDRNERLALRMPTIFHAYKLWVNGVLLARSEERRVGKDVRSRQLA